MSAELTEVLVSRFVQVAQHQMGKPYTWNAKGPAAFDCSGLLTFAGFVATAGKKDLRGTHNAQAIYDFCEPVLVPELGTLCLYRSKDGSHISHVEIYLGREMCFGASGGDQHTLSPTPGARVQVKLSYLSHPGFAGFRRPDKLLTMEPHNA